MPSSKELASSFGLPVDPFKTMLLLRQFCVLRQILILANLHYYPPNHNTRNLVTFNFARIPTVISRESSSK